MGSFRLTRLAGKDLDGIAAYTRDYWGHAQAVRYLSQMDTMFIRLADAPSLGRDRSDLRPGLLAYPCNRHVIFFRRTRDGIVEILRILHQVQDHQRHL